MLRLTSFVSVIALYSALGSEGAKIPDGGAWKSAEPKAPDRSERGKCYSQRCKYIDQLFAMSSEITLDPCNDWFNYTCEDYGTRIRDYYYFRKGRIMISETTMASEGIWDSAKHPLGFPHYWEGFREPKIDPGADVSTFNRMRIFYDNCMDTAAIWRNGLDPLRRLTDQIHKFFTDDKGNPIEHSTMLLSHYRMWAFASFQPQRSHFDNSKMRLHIAPHLPGAMPTAEMYFEEKYVTQYKQAIAEFLGEVYKGHRKPNSVALAKDIFDLEKKIIHELAPSKLEWDMPGKHLQVMSLKDLDASVPFLSLRKVIMRHPGVKSNPIDTIEVMFLDSLKNISSLFENTPYETLRAYFCWQFFAQTRSALIDDKAVFWLRKMAREKHEWKHDPWDYIECRKRTAKYWGPAMAAVWVNHTVDPRQHKVRDAENIVETIRLELRRQIAATPWMDNQTRLNALYKIDKMTYDVGFSKESPNVLDWDELRKMYEGYDIEKMDLKKKNPKYFWDYLRIENWEMRKEWEQKLNKPPPKHPWPIHPWEIKPHYSHLQNRIFVPAGLLNIPWFEQTELPLYGIYAGMGAQVAREMAMAITPIGMQYTGDGVLGKVIASKATEKAYNDRLACYYNKYNNMEVSSKGGPIYRLNGDQILSRAVADTLGDDLAYAAWKSTQTGKPDPVPLWMGGFTNDQLFWIFRNMLYCNRERPNFLGSGILLDRHLPLRTQAEHTIRHSKAWHEAFNCKPREKMCRIIGEDVDVNNLRMQKNHMPSYMLPKSMQEANDLLWAGIKTYNMGTTMEFMEKLQLFDETE